MEPLICPHCEGNLFEMYVVAENYNGTCVVKYGCNCGYTEIRLEQSEEPPFEEPDYLTEDDLYVDYMMPWETDWFDGDDEMYPGEFRH